MRFEARTGAISGSSGMTTSLGGRPRFFGTIGSCSCTIICSWALLGSSSMPASAWISFGCLKSAPTVLVGLSGFRLWQIGMLWNVIYAGAFVSMELEKIRQL